MTALSPTPLATAISSAFIDVDNKVIHEPIINFRHVFHVVDGRKFADESSKDVQSNEEFLARELMQFYARANKDLNPYYKSYAGERRSPLQPLLQESRRHI